MATTRVKTRIPDSREVTITLPSEFPVGDAELEIAVREPMMEFDVVLSPDNRPRAFPPRPSDPNLAAEHDAFLRLLPALMAQHAGKYVAVNGGQVVAVADSEVEVLNLAHRLFPGIKPLIRRVTTEAEPLQRLPIFRPVSVG